MDDNTRHRSRLPMRARVATTVGGAAATVSRLAGKGDGSVIGGVISLRLAPDLLSLLAAGRQGARVAVLETDEKYIPAMVRTTRPKVVVLLNLSRDQMDRAAEIWLLARRWREALANAPGCRVVANADDPLVAWAASSAQEVTWVAAGQRWREDSWCCPHCGAHLQRDGDEWSCKECGLRRPPVSWILYGDQVVDPA